MSVPAINLWRGRRDGKRETVDKREPKLIT